MFVMVDGWVFQVPPETEFIEFVSSHEAGHAGGVVFLDVDGRKMPKKYRRLYKESERWFRRIQEDVEEDALAEFESRHPHPSER